MRDEDDIMDEIQVYELALEAANDSLTEFLSQHIKKLNKELTEWRFTHGEKVYEPKRVESDDE
jgi:hypothetical protein